MQWLLTGLSTVACVVAVAFAIDARVSAAHAHSARIRLEAQRGKLIGLEHATEALRDWLQRLQGKVSSMRVAPMGSQEAPEPASAGPYEVCENWLTAKREGPGSAAASCECAFCVDARAKRAALRGELLPARGPQAHAEQVRDHHARA